MRPTIAGKQLNNCNRVCCAELLKSWLNQDTHAAADASPYSYTANLMGGTTSSVIDHAYATHNRRDRAGAALTNLDSRLDVLRQEVRNRPQAITKGVVDTTSALDDAVILRYSQLQDSRVVEENVEKIFQKFPGREHVIIATHDMIASMSNTKSSSLQGWKHHKKFKKHKGKDIGIEIHFKTEMFEDAQTSDTVVLIAYKCLAHIMDTKVNHGYLDVDQLSESMISLNIQGMSLEVSSYSYSRTTTSYGVTQTRQKVLSPNIKIKPVQLNQNKCSTSWSYAQASGVMLTTDSESDDDSSSTSRPVNGELSSDDDSDQNPRSRHRLSSAWPSLGPRGQLPSLSSRMPISRRLRREWPFSSEW